MPPSKPSPRSMDLNIQINLEILSVASFFFFFFLTDWMRKKAEALLAGSTEIDLKVLLIRLKRVRDWGGSDENRYMRHWHLCLCGERFSAAQPTSQSLACSRATYVTFKTRFPRKMATVVSEGGTFLIKKWIFGFSELEFTSSDICGKQKGKITGLIFSVLKLSFLILDLKWTLHFEINLVFFLRLKQKQKFCLYS